jgi:hypothetical protein
MKPQAKLQNLQLNLPWLDLILRPAVLPQDKERELAQALAELLLSVAMEGPVKQVEGGEDEREADR